MNTWIFVGIGVVIVIVIVIIVLLATGAFKKVSEDGKPTDEKKTEALQRARLVDPRTAADRRRDRMYAY
jgi:uncharacterized protein YpmB